MTLFRWDPKLETGNQPIDDDHRALFALANQIDEAIHREEGGAAVDQVLETLEHHARSHFDREEQLMRQVDFPDTEFHIRHHGQMWFMLQTFLTRRRMARTADLRTVLSHETLNFLDDWIRLHIECFDKRLIDFVRSGGASGVPG